MNSCSGFEIYIHYVCMPVFMKIRNVQSPANQKA